MLKRRDWQLDSHENTSEELLYPTRDILSDLAISDNEKDGDDKADNEEEPEQGKLGKDENPGWVMGTIFKTAQPYT